MSNCVIATPRYPFRIPERKPRPARPLPTKKAPANGCPSNQGRKLRCQATAPGTCVSRGSPPLAAGSDRRSNTTTSSSTRPRRRWSFRRSSFRRRTRRSQSSPHLRPMASAMSRVRSAPSCWDTGATPTAARAGALHVPPLQGHHHFRWRKRLKPRGRGSADPAPGRDAGRGGGAARCEMGRDALCLCRIEAGRHQARRCRGLCLLQEPAGPFQGAKTLVFGPLPKTSTGKIQKFLLRDQAKSLEKA